MSGYDWQPNPHTGGHEVRVDPDNHLKVWEPHGEWRIAPKINPEFSIDEIDEHSDPYEIMHRMFDPEGVVVHSGNPRYQWRHTLRDNGTRSLGVYAKGEADSLEQAMADAEESHRRLVGFDPETDPFDPRQFGASRRFATIQWPEDLSHHLNEPTGYSAGYAARHHPAFIDGGGYPNYSDAEEAYYGHAGGTGPEFEDGYDDASGDLPHKIDQPEDYAAHHGGQADHKKRMRQMVDDQRQQEHNTLRSMGDFTVTDDFLPSRTPWNSTKHPAGSWEGCPTCNPRHEMASDDYTDPDDNVDPFDPRLIGASRIASGGHDWQRDPEGESASPDGRAESWRAEVNDDHHMTVFRKNPSAVYDEDDDSDYARAERDYPHPVSMDTPWSYHLHGVGYNDNPYLKFHTPYDDNPHHTGFPDRQTAQSAAEAAYHTLSGTGQPGPDPDDTQDPFDPRLIGASRHHAVGENYGGSWHEEHYDKNGDYVGPPWPQDMSHHLHSDPVQAPYNAGYHAAWHPAFVNLDDPVGEARSAWTNAGGPTKEIEDFSTFEDGWEDALNGIPHMWLSPDAHQAYLEGDNDDLRKFNPKRRQDHADAVRSLDTSGSGWDPDDNQDPFDPRMIGAGLRRTGRDRMVISPRMQEILRQVRENPAPPQDPEEVARHNRELMQGNQIAQERASRKKLLQNLENEFHGWYAENGNERLNWAGRGPLGNWRQIENFLKDRYPAAHKGITTGKEETGHLLDTGQLGPDGDYCPTCHGQGHHVLYTDRTCVSCGGTGKPDQPMAYETGPDAIARHGYDPKEIAAGMLLLHNRTHNLRSDMEQADNDRLSEIARMRSQMQPREAALRIAAHEHVESGQRGRPEWTGCAHPECRPDLPTTMFHMSHPSNRESIAQHGLLTSYSQDDEFSDELGMPHGLYMTSDEPKLSHDTERFPGDVWAIDTTKLSHLENDFPGGMLFRNAFATKYDVPPDALRLHRPSAYRTAARRRELIASLDYADIIRLAGDGMSWEDTMSHIDSVLAEGENQDHQDVEPTKGVPAWYMAHDDDDGPYDDPGRECDACGAVDDKDDMYVTDSEKDGSLQWHCDPCAERIYQRKLNSTH